MNIMKKSIFFISLLILIFLGCQKEDRFTHDHYGALDIWVHRGPEVTS